MAGSAERLTPHEFKTQVLVEKFTTKLYVPADVLAEMHAIVDICDDEVGWMGDATRDGDDYCLNKIYLLNQQAHRTTTELDPSAIGDLVSGFIKDHGPEEGSKMAGRISFWGHSHVNAEVNPSGQDDDTIKQFKENDNDFFIRAILNKKGKMRVDVFDFKRGVQWLDIPWVICANITDQRRKELETEIKSKVRPFQYAQPYTSPYQWQQPLAKPTNPPPPRRNVVARNDDDTIFPPGSAWRSQEQLKAKKRQALLPPLQEQDAPGTNGAGLDNQPSETEVSPT